MLKESGSRLFLFLPSSTCQIVPMFPSHLGCPCSTFYIIPFLDRITFLIVFPGEVVRTARKGIDLRRFGSSRGERERESEREHS